MRDRRIHELFEIESRFLRSVQLERDFRDPTALSGYVRTDFVQESCDRIADGLRPDSGRRAWRITGDYGSGKSSFALLLANALSRPESELPPQVRRVIDFSKLGLPRQQFLPLLVTCSREPLGLSILRAMRRSVESLYRRGAKVRPIELIERLLAGQSAPSDEQVVGAVLETNTRLIADSKAQGILLIVDELGKFLEFAALHPHRQDVFLLQLLAETASRSGPEPLFVIGLLHQGFNAYADQLNQSAQREWEKVAGRLEEIVFDQPVDQLGHLIASALNVRTDLVPKAQAASLRHAMRQTIDLAWFPAAQRGSLLELAPRLFPLHPTVLPVLIRVFRRFGQNERSLFSFLFSNEPYGLRAFAEQRIAGAQPFRLHNLFDYVRTNLGHRLATHSYRSHWNLIDSVIESYATNDPIQLEVLKTVGLLNLLNDDLLATGESLRCALADDDAARQRQVKAAVDRLHRTKRVLYDRGRSGGLCLWPHTSVDIEQAYEEARRAIQTPRRVAPFITDQLETRPVVARRHYIETGNLRHYEVRYCPVADLPALLEGPLPDADGLIVVPLCESVDERDAALTFAQAEPLRHRSNWLVALPQPLNNLAPLLEEVQRWEWVAANTPELSADKCGKEEVSAKLRTARQELERCVRTLIGFGQFAGCAGITWFNRAEPLRIHGARHLLSELSRVFDETYHLAPRVHNELVNRRNLSSAAAAARMRLIERMIEHIAEPSLGMSLEKWPPELSMYLSVLRNTGIHQPRDGHWSIGEPDAGQDTRCRVGPALRLVGTVIESAPDARVNVAALFERLRKPPLGVRDGLMPILLTAFAVAHRRQLAIYKDGRFLRELTGESMLVLTKQPSRFELQLCRVKGFQVDVVQQLLAAIGHERRGDQGVELLDAVRPLCASAAELPSYAHQTKRLSATTAAIRDLLLNAREPARLLFADLPKACGLEPFPPVIPNGLQVVTFVRSLTAALGELRSVYPELQRRLKRSLREAFDLPGDFWEYRTFLAARAEQVVLGVSEPGLRAFCLRLIDHKLPEADWVDSLGSLLALKPPANWQDNDESAFAQELGRLASSFRRIEGRLFGRAAPSAKSVGIRLTVTQATGFERETVIYSRPEEEPRIRQMQTAFQSLLAQHRRLGLGAAALAVWTTMEAGELARS